MKTAIALFAGALLGLNAHAATLSVGSTNDIKYWWDFEGTNVPVNGAGTPQTGWNGSFGHKEGDSFGTINSSKGENPSITGVTGISADNFTISLAVRKGDIEFGLAPIFSLSFGADGENPLSFGGFDPKNQNQFYIDYTGGGGEFGSYGDLTGSTFKTITLTSSSIAGGTQLTFYLDGKLLFQQDVIGQAWTSEQLSGISFGEDSYGYFWDSAEVDNVGVWSSVLTPEEILELAAVPEPSSVALVLLGGAALVLRRRRRVA